jgi:DNA-binding MarR family transcriptional regulator
VTRALRDVQRASVEVRRALARRLSLGVTDVAALDHLLEHDAPLGSVELGNRLGIRSASATTLADRLERSGHLIRQPDPTDRRRQTLIPTAKARTDALNALAPLLQGLQDAADQLTDEEAAIVIRYLNQAASIMAEYAAAPTTPPVGPEG